MPWIRYKHWTRARPLTPHVAHCASGRRYLWNGDQEGVTCVPFQADAEELLHGQGDPVSPYALAYERYGIAFDAQGAEVTPPPPPDLPVPVMPPTRGPGRPKKA